MIVSNYLPKAETRLVRLGLVIGAGVLIAGLGLGVVSLVRPEGLGVATTLAGSPLHLQASIQVFCGAVALILAVLWHLTSDQRRFFSHLRPLVTLALLMCAVSAGLMIGFNWLIMEGMVAHYFALIPAVSIVFTAVIYALIVRPLSGTTSVNLGARLMLRSSYVWLLVTATVQFVWIAARSFERSNLLWFLERPAFEAALLGFVLFGSLGLILAGLSSVLHSRDLIRATVNAHQAANVLVFVWAAMQAWVLRFPGSYQALVLSLAGVGILICCITMGNSSKVAIGSGRGEEDPALRFGNLLGAVAIATKTVGAILLTATAVVATSTGEMPLQSLFAAFLICVGTGVVSFSAVAVIVSLQDRVNLLTSAGAALLVIGTFCALGLWSLVVLVDRPLHLHIAGAEALIALGLLSIIVALPFARFPTE